jgi:hypothetical protein
MARHLVLDTVPSTDAGSMSSWLLIHWDRMGFDYDLGEGNKAPTVWPLDGDWDVLRHRLDEAGVRYHEPGARPTDGSDAGMRDEHLRGRTDRTSWPGRAVHPERKGKLGGKGYVERAWTGVKGRKRLLDEAVEVWGYRSVLGSIQFLERMDEIRKRYGGMLQHDRVYLRETYGGQGSFSEELPADERLCGPSHDGPTSIEDEPLPVLGRPGANPGHG